MNAADRRRLTPALAALAAVLALLLIALWMGLGRGARWHDNPTPPKFPPIGATTPAPTVPPLEQYAEVWQHPLFSPTRTPEAPSGRGAGASGDLQLTGVILLPGLRMAIVHDRSTGKDYRVVEGQPARGAPTLVELHPRSAILESSGSRMELRLIPGPSPDAGRPAAAEPHGGSRQSTPGHSADEGASAMVTRHGGQDSAAGREPAATPASAGARASALKSRIEQARRRGAQQNDGD
jgi:general secretion pathway protein N